MKKLFAGVIIGAVLMAVLTRASSVLIGTLTTVNNTTQNSTSFVYGNYIPTQPQFLITDAGLTATTALTANWQISVDNANWLTIATYNPPVTNAGTYAWNPTLAQSNFFCRLQIVTTNSVQVGAIQTQ